MTDDDPLWYKDAIIYEVHVRAFQDSIADGVGDFKGLRQRLDYLQDLGITAIWLLPFYPSPLKDDGYDIADYTSVHPSYGTLKDFRDFLDAAHQRGLKVITELVINHTSDQHPWFQRARRAPKGSPERDMYVWSDTTDKYKEARIIFKDFERSNWTYDPVADQYYWHRFYSHQPDLNFDNPAVWDALVPVLEFWLDMGVDGLRLDAIPYLFEREGTNCENLPETHAFLKRLRAHLDSKYQNRMFLAEANQWPEDAIAYFGDGDECHMAFHFPVMPRLYMALHQEDRFPIIDILEQTPAIPDNCQWCMFLRNHDELTLEMVTDEERDYMYRAYASDPQARINLGIRRRLAPLLRNDRRRIELMNALLFSMPGTPVIYYGDEIGMGDNFYLGDRNGVRTPMQWSGDRNAGFSKANPQKLYLPVIIDPEYHYEAVNVDAQQGNSSSLLWWMKRIIALRKQFRAFGRGTIEFLRPDNPKILAFIRRYEDETILIVANLSRFVQYVQLDLSEFKGLVPHELVGRNPFPPIGELPYLLTQGPHGYYAFAIRPAAGRHPVLADKPREAPVPRIAVRESWEELLHPSRFNWLEPAIISHLAESPGFGGMGHWKTRTLRNATIRFAARLPSTTPPAVLLFLDLEFLNGSTHMQVQPIGYATVEMKGTLPPGAIVAAVTQAGNVVGVLYDARSDAQFCSGALKGIAQNTGFLFDGGEIVCSHFPQFDTARGPAEVPLPITVSQTPARNVSINYGGKMVLKSFEKLEPGINPDLELGRFLTDHTAFDKLAPVLGAIEYRPLENGPTTTLSVLFGYIPNEGDGWQYTLDTLSRFYESVLVHSVESPPMAPPWNWTPGVCAVPTGTAADYLNSSLRTAARLGTTTAELHRGLASATHPALAPEPFTKLYQRSVYQSLRTTTGLVFRELARNLPELPDGVRELAAQVLARESELSHRYRAFLRPEVSSARIRIHGDYQLSELLYTGTDFVIIDFEGNPARPLTERQIKRSPLRDIATMIRSFHSAAYSPLFGAESTRGILPGHVREEDRNRLLPWARFWFAWVTSTFVQSYYAGMSDTGLLPADPDGCRAMLELLVLEKSVSELGYELAHRPAWVPVSLQALHELLAATDRAD
ncbi:MAG: maltose alpha-D-glucosyltransferase [Bacteroidales bacterium]|nr:maltose alpha-D-glucosyltransferase [Bacteroidales bacterium]